MVASNARRQNMILLYMKSKKVKSISALAEELNASRPSISRAMNALASEALVVKDHKTWVLTSTGKVEAQRLQDEMPLKVEKTAQSISKLLENQGILAGVDFGFSADVAA